MAVIAQLTIRKENAGLFAKLPPMNFREHLGYLLNGYSIRRLMVLAKQAIELEVQIKA